MKKLLFLVGIFLITPVFASVELVQIVSFSWDGSKLESLSLGSGTAIGPDLILTNKHVVTEDDGTSAEFILICPAKTKSTRAVDCNVPAVVLALHPKFDAALIRTLDDDVYLPQVRLGTHLRSKNEWIRVQGFPVPVEGLQNFGGNKTLENIRNWTKNGGVLTTAGDKLTITRGQIKQLAQRKDTGEIYYLTDVKVNHGNSGGAAFDRNGDFIGIPTLRDLNFNAFVLAYPQLQEWVSENANTPAIVDQEILDFYKTKIKTTKTISKVTTNTKSKNTSRAWQRTVVPVKKTRIRTFSRQPSTTRNTSSRTSIRNYLRKYYRSRE